MLVRFKKWWREDKANAAIEAGLLFPIMLFMLCGTVDMGVGLLLNQKVINASQSVADLLAREQDISDAVMDDAIIAGRMSLQPYATTSYGVDIAGIQFIGATLSPTVQWRDTVNMTPNNDITEDSRGLGTQNEGVIAVTVRYYYTPYFSKILFTGLQMEEVAYVRGRKGLFVTRS